MNITEYLLTKLSEEATEVAQRCCKIQCFGIDEVQPGQTLSNRERLALEVRDFFVVLEELQRIIGPLPDLHSEELKAQKLAKLYKYMEYSVSQGTLCG